MFSPSRQGLQNKSSNNCSNSFGERIGTNSNVEAYSNWSSQYISSESNYITLPHNHKIFTGLKWQCVEYARRYLINVLNVTFQDVNNAYEIFDIKTVSSIYNRKRIILLDILTETMKSLKNMIFSYLKKQCIALMVM